MKSWFSKFSYKLEVSSSRYVHITLDEDSPNEVLLFPDQARELAAELLLLADKAEQERKGEDK